MGCSSCSTTSGKPGGCKSNGTCGTGGCNKMNTYDWLSQLDIAEPEEYRIVEVSFKNGSRKDFYFNPPYLDAVTGDTVSVEADGGFNVGVISLSGELARLQMKKKRIRPKERYPKILRLAARQDVLSLEDARSIEKDTMIRARVIARSLNLNMKIGEVEFQADKKKATFYYIADGRVDFRELIRHYAKEFRIKVDMRQIGSRQESGLIGGLGSCGRELCCSTWLSNFNSVSTSAARYQNLSINQVKLSGQCGRLKCCLNFELNTYLDALRHFPKQAMTLKTEAGSARLVKKDIFKGLMYYSYNNAGFRSKLYALEIDSVKEILALNKEGKFPVELRGMDVYEQVGDTEEHGYEDVTGAVELPEMQKKRRNRKRPSGKRKKSNSSKGNNPSRSKSTQNKSGDKKSNNTAKAKKSSNNRKTNNSKNKNKNTEK